MSSLIDLRWLLILPVGLILFFVCWVFRNLCCEIWAEKRRWVLTYRDPDAKFD